MSIPKMTPNTINKIFKCTYIAFIGLGAYRGAKSYNYEYKTDIIKHNERVKVYGTSWDAAQIEKNKPQYFYGGCAFRSIWGMVLYASPFGVVMFAKEIYRLEVNLRGIESEKQCGLYNYLLLGE